MVNAYLHGGCFCLLALLSGLRSTAEAVPRIPPLTQPAEGSPLKWAGDARQYTDYKPADSAAAQKEITDVAKNGSFVSRCVLMLSRNGTSKNFETITGQDGLTFGVKDFATDDGALSFMRALNKEYPSKFAAAFGEHSANLLSAKFIHDNNHGGHGSQGANDQGLIRFQWLRIGLDKILSDRQLHGFQLRHFVNETVNPSYAVFQKNQFQLEFTLATMIGLANSGGMEGYLKKAKANATGSGLDYEKHVAALMLTYYVQSESGYTETDMKIVRVGLGQTPGPMPKEDAADVTHRGHRAHEIFDRFSYTQALPFKELGKFSLASDEDLSH